MTSVVLNVEPGGNMKMKTGTEQGKVYLLHQGLRKYYTTPSGLAPRKTFDFDTMRPGTKYEHFL
jgi:hypothetical protein